MLGREMVVISGWVGQGENALCGNRKIPLGIYISLGLRLLTSSIFQVGLGVVVWGGLALWLREGYGGHLLFWYGGTPSEDWWGYFGLNLAYGQSV